VSFVQLTRLHAQASARYAAAYTDFRDAYCELRAVERTAMNSNIGVPLTAVFPTSNVPDPRAFVHSNLIPLMPWDDWKARIENRANELLAKFNRKET
jgi:hypothetical protein